MNKLKIAIKNLEDYLGKDEHGVRLLQACAKIANEMRKELAALKEENTQLQQKIDKNDEKAKQDIVLAVQKANEINENKVKDLSAKVTHYKKRLEKEEAEKMQEPVQFDLLCPKARLNHLRILKKDMPFLPKPHYGNGNTYFYCITQLAKDFTFSEMAKVGMFVTVASSCVNVAIKMVPPSKTTLSLDSSASEDAKEYAKEFLYWFGKKGVQESVDERIVKQLRAKTIGRQLN